MIKKHIEVYATDDKQSVATVCTMFDTETGRTARGVSVKSGDDEYDAAIGVRNAERHALHAMKGRRDRPINDKRAIYQVVRCGCPFIYHSERYPVFTFRERRRLYGKTMQNPSGKLCTHIINMTSAARMAFGKTLDL